MLLSFIKTYKRHFFNMKTQNLGFISEKILIHIICMHINFRFFFFFFKWQHSLKIVGYMKRSP